MTNSDEAAGYISTHCQHLGSYGGDGSPYQFLTRVAKEMVAAPPTELFPERYKEHVAFAIDMVANHGITMPQAAIAAVYLATRFEFFFRMLSGKLKEDGSWLNKAVDQPAAIAKLGETGLKGDRISNVAVTYRLMKLDPSRPAVQVLDKLDIHTRSSCAYHWSADRIWREATWIGFPRAAGGRPRAKAGSFAYLTGNARFLSFLPS
jgi:hypothetical protein